VELGRHDVIARDDRGEALAVLRTCDNVFAIGHAIRVQEIRELTAAQAGDKWMRALDGKIVPAHVRHARRRRETPDRTTQQTQSRVPAVLIARLEQRLHADANSQEQPARRDVRADRRIEAALGQGIHRGAECTVARQNRGVRGCQAGGVPGQEEAHPATLKRRNERADVAAAVVDDDQPLLFHSPTLPEYNRRIMRRFCLFFVSLALLVAPVSAQDARTLDGITVPAGFTIEVIAHVPQARELVVASNGDLFVGTSTSDVYIVPDAEGGTVRAAAVFTTVDDKPVAGVTIDGDTMYLGAQFGVYRLPFHVGDRTARAKPVKIASVRTSGRSRDHVTTTVAVTKGVLYASVGSSCDACVPDLDDTRATIQQMHLDGSDMTPKAEHIRNAIALAVNPESGALWAGVAEQDALAPGHPYEKFDDISAHSGVVDYGYPYCYENRKPIDATHTCANATVARVYTPAYNTPIGATFYPVNQKGRYAFPAEYRGGAFIALHGSWHRPLVPPRVAFVPMNGDEPKTPMNWTDPTTQWREFVGGFQRADDTRVARATGVAVGPDGSLFVSDDFAGNIYRIRPKR